MKCFLGLIAMFGLAGCPMNESDAGGGGSNEGGGAPGGGAEGGGGSNEGGGAVGGEGGASVMPTHAALISIQDVAIHGAPELGHGLTVQIGFTPLRAPDYEEVPGSPLGCKAWVYEVGDPDNGLPIATDEGKVMIGGLSPDPIECALLPDRGYVCPVEGGDAPASILVIGNGLSSFTVTGDITFDETHVGKYLRLSGATTPSNVGSFPIVGLDGDKTLLIAAPAAAQESFDASFEVLAGAGPIPGAPVDPLVGGETITVGIEPGGAEHFDWVDAEVTAGGAFELDDATAATLSSVPLDGASVTFSCAGEGGACGKSDATVVRVSTTDGDISGLPLFAMPTAVGRQVEIQCADLSDAGTITIPAEAMELLAAANGLSPITRVRTAFMREGVAVLSATEPLPPNPVRILVGHGVLGFTDSGRDN
ncbi:MAG: hypothetical protein HOW73_12000 [Polyangiaceae bacterium]|nr:hypothetical protein [Polyangiaceae bacterium]